MTDLRRAGADPAATAERNWAGNLTYSAASVQHPGSVGELCELVASSVRVRALGTRHSFNDVADTSGTLVTIDQLGGDVVIDPDLRAVSLPAGMRYGDLAEVLDAAGWALANLASLPHVSVAGAVATGTHGSGDQSQTLAAAVRELDLVVADGSVTTIKRGEPDFAGVVVGLGALGVVSRIVLDIEPTYGLRQDVYRGLGWERLVAEFDTVAAAGYSVSLMLDWATEASSSVLMKSRTSDVPDDLLDARRVSGDSPTRPALTDRSGAMGPWHLRLPHFRLAHGPSHGEELQSEYLLPREHTGAALEALRPLGHLLAPALLSTEVRTMRADDLWLSPAYWRDTVGIHFTWKQLPDLVVPLLPQIEERLAPFSSRPHWGKLSRVAAEDIRGLFPRFDDFAALRDRLDPDRKFGNAFTERLFGS